MCSSRTRSSAASSATAGTGTFRRASIARSSQLWTLAPAPSRPGRAQQHAWNRHIQGHTTCTSQQIWTKKQKSLGAGTVPGHCQQHKSWYASDAHSSALSYQGGLNCRSCCRELASIPIWLRLWVWGACQLLPNVVLASTLSLSRSSAQRQAHTSAHSAPVHVLISDVLCRWQQPAARLW